MLLIVVWNLHTREALDNANKDWLQLLKRDLPEAHWLPLQPPILPYHRGVTAYLSTPSIKQLEEET
eukprot:1136589-Pelagomonas_calceolata.AAC.4